MGIDSESSLFVGAYHKDINCSQELLDELCDEGYLFRVSPYYDAPNNHCYYGITVSCDEIMAEGGIDKIRGYITEMNLRFGTTVCELMHSPHIW
jgi:hypothetical protein